MKWGREGGSPAPLRLDIHTASDSVEADVDEGVKAFRLPDRLQLFGLFPVAGFVFPGGHFLFDALHRLAGQGAFSVFLHDMKF